MLFEVQNVGRRCRPGLKYRGSGCLEHLGLLRWLAVDMGVSCRPSYVTLGRAMMT